MLKTLNVLRMLTLALVLAALAVPVRAEYPNRSVRIVVGLQAGASTDVLARLIGQKLGERLNQTVIVDNKPGAATRIGMEVMAKAAPDGYTLGVANAVTTSFPLMFDNFAFTPGKDFVAVSMLGRAPSFLAVRVNLPARSVKDFVAFAKAHSGKLTFGHGGTGSNPHIAALTLLKSLGVEAVAVPYKGNAPTALALGAGDIDFAMLDYPSVRSLAETGKVRLLAVTEPKRMASLPDMPTSGEQGLTREIDGVTPWFMLVAPASTPPAVVALLNRQVNEILQQRDVRQVLLASGIEPEGSSSTDAQLYFQSQRERITRLARELDVSFRN